MKVRLDDISSLDRLISSAEPDYRVLSNSNLELHFSVLSEQEKRYWTDRINHHRAACGCPQGAAAIFLSMTCFVAYLFFRQAGFDLSWYTGLQAVGLFVLSGAIGKSIGLLLGKVRLKRTIMELKDLLQERITEPHLPV